MTRAALLLLALLALLLLAGCTITVRPNHMTIRSANVAVTCACWADDRAAGRAVRRGGREALA